MFIINAVAVAISVHLVKEHEKDPNILALVLIGVLSIGKDE